MDSFCGPLLTQFLLNADYQVPVSLVMFASRMYGCILLTLLLPAYLCQQSSRPNIVLIVADDLGWQDVGFHGSSQIVTPAMDALAYDGIILNNYYVQPICTPSRAALLSAKHPIHLGLQTGVILGSEPYGLALTERILPAYLKSLDYATHMVGKWHIGYQSKEYTPTYRGFDSHYGYYGGCDDYWDHTYKGPGGWGLDFWNNLEPEKTGFGQYSTILFTNKTERIISDHVKHNKDQPLFLYLPHQAPHNGNGWKGFNTTLQAPQYYIDKFAHIKNYNRRKVAAMISVLDESIGNVTKSLRDNGLLNNTIIVFTTDNGGPVNGQNFNMASNKPLRGSKYTLWEGGVRGVGWMWSPLLVKSGYVSMHMMQIFDWLPTLLHPAGFDMSQLPQDIDGIDLWDVLSLNKEKSVRNEMLHNIDKGAHNYALRLGDMKIKSGWDVGQDGWYPHSGQYDEPDPLTIYNKTYVNINMSSKNTADEFVINMKLNMKGILQSIGRKPHIGKPAGVECGLPPSDYTDCKPKVAPCLFNITADPCEYFNIAPYRTDWLDKLKTRVEVYNATAQPIRNRPLDPRGFPAKQGGIWRPWLTLQEALLIENKIL